jgi:hypothetical protein
MNFYRYQIEQHSHGGYDMDGNYVFSNFPPIITLNLIIYDLIKETPKGYWISQWKWFVTKKWVSKTSKKRYAYPTKEEALTNFIKRSEIRAKILKAQLNACKEGLNLANKLNENNYDNKNI